MDMMRSILRVVLAIDIVLLLLVVVSYALLDTSSGGAVVLGMALVPITLSLLGSSLLIAADWNPI